jgi:mannose-1-phosphate guanylyltransferase
MNLPGFWMDVGQPKDFLTGNALYLNSVSNKTPEKLHNAPYVQGNVLVDASAKIGKDCRIGPNVVIGPKVTIGNGVRLRNCVLFEGATVKDFSWVDKTIVGWHSSIGRWVRLEGVAVLGEDVSVCDELWVNGGRVLPHKSISQCVPEPQIIM